ncbi:hypothetical protein SAMN02745216_04269 [Desulfatibacillum alkenivorans DSM 16219]|jgi:hypothetical protein|uniref:Uncharacterized protein n=1 Tax=Desulfatibacillum alkenivorans DSM 16219 TaxID=1121393 RepID=A0A1M6W7D1_9BACT|nr:hypothetical protein [Desulfatibacillum alkenivorans]SHK89621.1 hypothetical protein SAMN02745216_04269 [Desulfatibacillum alkenivorans DSM 16219]
MKVKTKIDKVVLTAKNHYEEFLPYDQIPGYKVVENFFSTTDIPDEDDSRMKYMAIVRYIHEGKGSFMVAYFQRKTKWASPLYLIFWPDYFHEIPIVAVKRVQDFLWRKCRYEMRVSMVDVATDLIFDRDFDAYSKIIRTFKPGRKRKPDREWDTSVCFGKPSTPVRLIVYDKTEQLLAKHNVEIPEQVVRVEARFRMSKCNNFIQTVDDLASHNWGWLYPKYFSFHVKKPALTETLLDMGVEPKQPIWKLRDLMTGAGKTPSNFYRDCLVEHPKADLVRNSLSGYRWGRSVQ